MAKPDLKTLRSATGISQSYASMILTGGRAPSRPLAIHILRRTGWRHPILADLSDEQIAALETIEPWVAPAARSTPEHPAKAA